MKERWILDISINKEEIICSLMKGCQTASRELLLHALFSFYKNVVFPALAEYSHFSADFKAENVLVLFLNCSLLADSSVLEWTGFNNKLQ